MTANVSGPHVLLVDDDDLVVAAITRRLQRLGYRVRSHNAGFGLTEIIRKHPPDALVLDLSMPGLGGPAFLKAYRLLQERYSVPQFPVVLFSGLGVHELEQTLQEYGASAFVCKSEGIDALVVTLQRVLWDHDTSTHDPGNASTTASARGKKPRSTSA